MMKNDQRPNFFLLLGINPDDPWHEQKFAELLKKKRAEWARQSTTFIGKRKSDAEKNLELYPQITAIMHDAEAREKERQEAIEQQADLQVDRMKLFEKRLEVFNLKDDADQKEIDAFVKEFQDVVPATEILKRIRVEKREKITSSRPTLDATTAKTIAEKLQALNLNSLYELLACPPTTSTQVLADHARDLYKEVITHSIKNQAITYKGELAGQAISIFASDEQRERYDETLRQGRFNATIEELFKYSADKSLSKKQVEHFLDQMQMAGLERKATLQQLKEYVRDHRWSMPVIEEDASTKIPCGNCRTLNNTSNQYCVNCQLLLRIQCPKCGVNAESTSNACGNCSFPVGNRYLVDLQLQDVDEFLKKYAVPSARNMLDETALLWKPPRPDALTQRIEATALKVQREEKNQHKALETWQSLYTHTKLVAAKTFLEQAQGRYIPEAARHLQDIQHTFQDIQGLLQQARATTTTRDAKIALCKQILLLCSDHQETRELLKSLPPSSPSGLQAQVQGTHIRLKWQASTTHDVAYRIVRKRWTRPNHAADGYVLATIAGCEYEDSQPEIGLPLYYAIFALNEDVSSQEGAQLEQPRLLLESVRQARAEVGDQQVKLLWELPEHVDSVLVVRKDRLPPSSFTDGTLINECVAGQTSLVDRDVRNGQTYCYALYARFKNTEGKRVLAPAAHVRVIPEIPPELITELHVQKRQLQEAVWEVTLRWRKPAKGQVIIMKSRQRLPVETGAIVPASQLMQFGERLEYQEETVTDASVGRGVIYYTPVVLFNNQGYIGETYRLANVADVTTVLWHNLGDVLRLQWDWPDHCQEVALSYSTTGWPVDGSTPDMRVSRDEYERRGYVDLVGLARAQYFVLVTAIITEQHERIPARGVRLTAHVADLFTVTYEIRRTHLFQRQDLLLIHAIGSGALPKLLLIAAQDRLPVSKTDGELLHTIEQTPIDRQGLRIALHTRAIGARTYCKLFLADDDAYQMLDLNHPHEDKLRIH